MRLRAVQVVIAFFALLLPGCSTLLVDAYDYGGIDVKVVLESGEPVGGIELVLYRNSDILAYGKTNSAGEYQFNFVPFGLVGVYAQLAPAYETSDGKPSDYRHNIDLTDGRRIDLLFTGVRPIQRPEPSSAEPGA